MSLAPQKIVRRYPLVGLSLVVAVLVGGCASNYVDGEYRPIRAQHGKDVMWVPTPDALVTNMLQMAKVTSDDLVYDLGAGDGKIAIAVARQYGATAVGIEYNAEMADFAREQVQRAGVQDKVTIVTGDIFKEDFSRADVLTLYLLESLNVRLKPQILDMKPGTRVVSNTFRMGAWQPDATTSVDNGWSAYLWVVPAKVQGRWQFSGLDGVPAGVFDLKQSFQHVVGTYTPVSGQPQQVKGRLAGQHLRIGPDGPGMLSTGIDLLIQQDHWRPAAHPPVAHVAKRLP